MSTIPQILGSLSGIIIFLFIYWRRLREDYTSDILFTSGFLIAFSAIGGAVAFSFFLDIKGLPNYNPQGIWFWGANAGILLSLIIVINRFKMKFFETLEAIGMAFMPWFAIVLLIESIQKMQVQGYLLALLPIFAYILFIILETKYKKFAWYKSGKIGFSGLTALAILFLIRAPIGILSPNMISFMGKVDAISSAVLSFLLFFAVYNLSELE